MYISTFTPHYIAPQPLACRSVQAKIQTQPAGRIEKVPQTGFQENLPMFLAPPTWAPTLSFHSPKPLSEASHGACFLVVDLQVYEQSLAYILLVPITSIPSEPTGSQGSFNRQLLFRCKFPFQPRSPQRNLAPTVQYGTYKLCPNSAFKPT